MPEPAADPATANLDTLQALYPDRPRPDLAAYLAAAHGNLDRAFRAIDARQPIVHGSSHGPTKRARTRARGLDAWIRPAARTTSEGEVLVLSDSDDDGRGRGGAREAEQAPRKPRKEPSKSAFDVLRSAPAASSSSSPSSTSSTAPSSAPGPAYVSLPPLVLATPALVAQHTHGLVTLVEDALPPELAARLFARSVSESRGEGPGGEGPCAWLPFLSQLCTSALFLPLSDAQRRASSRPLEHAHPSPRASALTIPPSLPLLVAPAGTKNKWYLVDREVESPHTSCFFREVPDKLAQASGYDPAAFDEVRPPSLPRFLFPLCKTRSLIKRRSHARSRRSTGTTARTAPRAPSRPRWTRRGSSSASLSGSCSRAARGTSSSGTASGGRTLRSPTATAAPRRCVCAALCLSLSLARAFECEPR